MQDIADRIAKGTMFLDTVAPDWAGRINLETLELNNPRSCVLGQTFGEDLEAWDYSPYSHGLELLANYAAQGDDELDDDDFAVDYGFDITARMTYVELQQAWERVIAERQQQA